MTAAARYCYQQRLSTVELGRSSGGRRSGAGRSSGLNLDERELEFGTLRKVRARAQRDPFGLYYYYCR
eukprot:3440106-Rhodomonas_salina.1